ncbi:four-carbon acid sugar kinase family protein [Celeribacter arenosi]|uniref:Four-carbon acid sugar kinase family protein n=1 Tax=Celeribacter arenosi TaxID=792649 RepID=A0ABP7K6B4_9RHOB
MNSLPDGLLVAWYGDDFTGAAAVMEVLSFSGIPAMLFLDVPTEAQLAQYPDLRAVGVASTARASSPDEMDDALTPAFAALLSLDPALLHYKVCSTLDSSPVIGSIGRAIEIGADLTDPQIVPVLIAAPQMQRFQVFGHLFAGLGDQVYRLDRHPVMARHPVTPMAESDVARHIAAQSDRINATLWTGAPPPSRPDTIQVVTLDSQDARTETGAGRMIWEGHAENRFVVGSQGVEYALVRHWVETGALEQVDPPKGAGRANGMVVVSGSVSPTTAGQISWSRANGFQTLRFDATRAVANARALSAEVDRIVHEALAAIAAGRDPLIFTAEGPDDPAVAGLNSAVDAAGADMGAVNRRIGQALGEMLDRILTKSGIRRAVISGGDTSGYATKQLGIFALSALAPTIPGASLCKAHADGPMDGLELALKGGQMGSPDYFGWIRDGGGHR